MMLLEIGKLRHAGVIRLVVGEPMKQPVAERTEGVSREIQPASSAASTKTVTRKTSTHFLELIAAPP